MQQLKNQNSNPNDDRSWECFRNFVHVHMWDGFVYLFLLVCDSEENFNFLTTDFNEIKENILSLYQRGGTSNEKYSITNGIIDQYRKCRMKKDEEMRNELMLSIFRRLEAHDIYDPNLSNLVRIFNTMSTFQRRSLRNIFISRIYGYYLFAEYLSKEWNKNKRYQTKANIDEVPQLLNKEDNAKEQKINQNKNEKLYTDVLKSEMGVRKHESKEATEKFLTNEGSKKDLDNNKLKNKVQVTTTENNTLENEKDNEIEIKSTSQVSNSKEKEEKVKEEEVKESGNVKSSKHEKNKRPKRNSSHAKSKHGKREENIESKNGANDSSEKSQSEPTRKGSLRNSKNEHSNNDSMNLKQSSQENDVERLQQEIERLRQEAARHQAALGGITNVGWSDNDSNNSMQLTKDIEKLQKDLEDFTRVKRKDVEIKIEAASELFENYKCKTPLENKNMKLVLGAVLQQHLISFILKYAKDYFEHNDTSTENKLEAAVLSKTKELIKLTTRFQETRTGTDEHSRILPTKLRQQIYAALGHRGFSDLNDLNHPFITQLTKDLMDEMNKYRIITSKGKNKKFEKEIITIIIQVLRIFYFRLNTQEPIPLMEFYKSGEYFDPGVMESIGQIEKNEELEVEVCSFPVIALNKNLDEEERRVFTRAQVIVRLRT